MAAMSVQSVLSKCPQTALQAHNHKPPKLIQQCNNASSRWGLNNITQPDIDSLFAAIVLPKITYGLSVYAASPPDLNTVQESLTRCYNRNYISHHVNVSELVEKTDLAIANRTSKQPSHPLSTFCLVLKKALLTLEILEVCCHS